MFVFLFFFFKQKTAYEMRISDWSSDVCSSDLAMTNGARDMLSTPPARKSSPWAVATERAASAIAARPLPQSLFTVCAARLVGRPATSAAWRATFRASYPAWLVQPMITSSKFTGRQEDSETRFAGSTDERRVGKEWYSTRRSWGLPYYGKKKK